jgi:glutaminase
VSPTQDLSHLTDFIRQLHDKYRSNDEGRVATYIPELGKANPDHFGISLVSVDGQEFSVGDVAHAFTIQSICKPFAFLMALERHGRDGTLARVAVEPSGDAFNSVELQPGTNRPFNPMVNAGALAVASLIKGASPEEGTEEFVRRLSVAAGRPLEVDHAVYASESATGHRNRGIAHLLRNFEVIDDDVDHTLHQYFTQCSVLVTARDLAMMGATVANMGLNPVTGEDAFETKYVRDILAAMFTCGMYDYAGEWAYRIGVPAKSGVSGGVLAVLNRQFGLAVYSPRLDARGNSVRGIAVCVDLAEEFGLHAFDFMNFGSNFIRAM